MLYMQSDKTIGPSAVVNDGITRAQCALSSWFPLMPALLPLMAKSFPLTPELHAASEGMLKWLKAPTLPRPFVLDLLDFVLGNSAAVFR